MSGDSNETDGKNRVDEVELAALREADWKELHWRLRSLAHQRVALEAQEVNLLVEAEESQLYRRLGYSNMTEYMDRELHWGPHAANERLRVARELMALPLIAEEFKSGELCFSAVRELTRVATPENEHEFLTKAQGRTARDVERMVAGLKRGDGPEAKPDPKLIKKKIWLEVEVPIYARYRQKRTALDKEANKRLTDSEVLDRLLRDADAPLAGEVPKPAVQVALTTCRHCKESTVSVDGEQVPIDRATAERLTCDSVFIGDLESNVLTRPRPSIPESIRRKVMHRDGFACIVPGCRAKRNLEVHHIKNRQHGGQHTVENCGTLCSGHHDQNHDGRLVISGGPGNWKFEWFPDGGIETATTAQPWIFDEDDGDDQSVLRGSATRVRHLKLVDGEPTPGEVPSVGSPPVRLRIVKPDDDDASVPRGIET